MSCTRTAPWFWTMTTSSTFAHFTDGRWFLNRRHGGLEAQIAPVLGCAMHGRAEYGRTGLVSSRLPIIPSNGKECPVASDGAFFSLGWCRRSASLAPDDLDSQPESLQYLRGDLDLHEGAVGQN